MKLFKHVHLRDLGGKPLKEVGGGDMTLGSLAAQVLVAALEDQGVKQAEKRRRFELACQITHGTGAVDLEAEDVALLKKLVDKCYPSPLVSGQFAYLVEANHALPVEECGSEVKAA